MKKEHTHARISGEFQDYGINFINTIIFLCETVRKITKDANLVFMVDNNHRANPLSEESGAVFFILSSKR